MNNKLIKIISIGLGLMLVGCGKITLPSQRNHAKTEPMFCENQTQMNITTHLTFENQSDQTLVGQENQDGKKFSLFPDKTMVITKQDSIAYGNFTSYSQIAYQYIFYKVDANKTFGATEINFKFLLQKAMDKSTLGGTRFFSPRRSVGEVACVMMQRCPTTIIQCKATFHNIFPLNDGVINIPIGSISIGSKKND